VIAGQSQASRLEWVGRNHGRGKTAKTNFLYADGHVETKTIEDTLGSKWQWGKTIYSVRDATIFDNM
jgi:prepilin-type processing-associated H-X9-DG protein